MMHKVIEDCSILSLAFSLIMVTMLATLPYGSVGFLPIIPIGVGCLILYLRRYAEGKRFFFEVWIQEYPRGGMIFVVVATITMTFFTVTIIKEAEVRRIDIAYSFNATVDAAEAELEEFFR